ncbi:unnamed protein product, partial [Linum tenue]
MLIKLHGSCSRMRMGFLFLEDLAIEVCKGKFLQQNMRGRTESLTLAFALACKLLSLNLQDLFSICKTLIAPSSTL